MKPLLPLFLGLLLAGCATVPATKVLTRQDNGHAVTVPVGTTLVVQLPSNPTTGYAWTPVNVPAPVLKLIRSSYAQTPAPPAFAGVGGMDTFRFDALKAGSQILQLNYARVWEKGIPPVETVSFPVTVEP